MRVDLGVLSSSVDWFVIFVEFVVMVCLFLCLDIC